MMDQAEVDVDCPCCGESIGLLVDASVARQSYVEDCSVCCRPMQVDVACEDGEVVSVEVRRQD